MRTASDAALGSREYRLLHDAQVAGGDPVKRWYITFSGQAWDVQTKRIVDDGPRFGADEVLVYDDRWLETTEFYRLNQWLWNTPRMKGFGWFAWKPFILLHCLEHFMRDGDLVLFTD